MSLKKFILPLTLAAGAIGIWLFAGFAEDQPDQQTQRGSDKVAVDVMEPRRADVERKVSYRGRIEGSNDGMLSFRVAGTIEHIPVKEGQYVQKGTLLARLEADELRQRMLRAESELERAATKRNFWKQEYQIDSALVAEGAVSKSKFRQSRLNYFSAVSAYNAAQHALAEAQTMVARTHLRAPFDGYVGSIQMNPGVNTGPNQPVMFFHAGSLRVEVNVLDQDVRNGLQIGSPVYLEAIGCREKRGQIEAIGAHTRPPFESTRIYASFPGQCLKGRRPGSYVSVQLIQHTYKNALLVPESAIDLRGVRPRVFLVNEDSIVEPVSVELGVQRGHWRQVIGKLSGDDRIIMSGTVTVSPGTTVAVNESALELEQEQTEL